MPPLLSIILPILLFNNKKTYVSKKSVHKKLFELGCKGSSGVAVFGVRTGKYSFVQERIVEEKCAFWLIIQ